MAKTKSTNSFNNLISLYINDMKRFGYLKRGSLKNYPSWLKAVDKWNGGNSIKWIEAAMKGKNAVPFNDVENTYDTFVTSNGNSFISNGKSRNVGSNHKSSYLSFAKWMIGQYHANTWLSIDKSSDLESCRLIAKNALFCTIDVANKVKNGSVGCKGHKPSNTYSWFDNQYRRIKTCEKTSGNKIGDIVGGVTLDNNSKANIAIKNAIKQSIPVNGNFTDYMACHIWDDTCYNESYHTSVFNLVLVPTAIAGLTDYNDAVKELLQYESARRFGCYPNGLECPKKPKNYDKITIWRQQDEHNKAVNNTNPFQPI